MPRVGEVVELTIDDWGDKGRGIARVGRMVVLTDRGLPGDRVRARIAGRRQRHMIAEVAEILSPSPQRVDPPCRHFGLCGGCRLLDLEYGQQLADKVRHMREQLRRIGKIEDLPEIETIACEPPYRYRNKMEFSFGGVSGAGLHLGLHPRENFIDAFNLEECWLTHESVARVAGVVREYFSQRNEQPYHPELHTGFLRFCGVRLGVATGEILVNLITADRPWDDAEEFGERLRTRCPEVTTALWTVNAQRANIASGEVRTVFFGRGNLLERLGPYEFEIAPMGFFQVNTRQAEKLFGRVASWAANGATDEILDLYSGAGAISLFLSPHTRKVTAVESHAESVEAARRNAERNGVTNCDFVTGDVLEFLRARVSPGVSLPTVVIDPPRAGLHPKAVKTLISVRPARIVYVSCNPPNLARDLEMMGKSYRVTSLAAVDMFPHTPHVEAVALLEARAD
ncbi:MAG: 23S rRNA (uracil(1939)-C(5))-methyltransferase RlmD [candidate division Zixibacteria bacterium]|nr:23S rRNA (uracil(1939)-C(5))-methyltransferase RlmD [candidate division Zixibacteria bacterium]